MLELEEAPFQRVGGESALMCWQLQLGRYETVIIEGVCMNVGGCSNFDGAGSRSDGDSDR